MLSAFLENKKIMDAISIFNYDSRLAKKCIYVFLGKKETHVQLCELIMIPNIECQ